MKTISKIIILLFFASVISCQKETSKSAGCDFNGLWLGTWNSPGNASGTFFAPVTQENTALTGDVYIRFDLPSLENHGVDFSAKVTDKNVKSVFDISGVNINVSGTVDKDTTVNGTFNVAIGMNGVFNGTKIPTSTPVATEIYNTGNALTSIVYIDQKLWAFTNNGIYDGWDSFKYVVRRINLNGALVDTLLMPLAGSSMGSRISYDGQQFWVLEGGSAKVYTYDLQGNKLNTYSTTAYYADALACIDNQVFITDGYNRVTHILDQNGQEIKTFPNKYISISALCKYNGYLYMATNFYNTILKTDLNGNILKAYTSPDNVISICSNGAKVWILTEKYVSVTDRNGTPMPGTTMYKIYEVQLE